MDQPNLLQYIRDRLPARTDAKYRERLEEIAKGADVPVHTLLKIWNGETGDPRVSTVESLIRYFQEREAA